MKYIIVSTYKTEGMTDGMIMIAHGGMLWLWHNSDFHPDWLYNSKALANKALKRLNSGTFRKRYRIENATFEVREVK